MHFIVKLILGTLIQSIEINRFKRDKKKKLMTMENVFIF